MPEVATSRKHHREAMLIGRGNDFLVSDRAPRLHDRGGPRLCNRIETVTKRKERIGRDY